MAGHSGTNLGDAFGLVDIDAPVPERARIALAVLNVEQAETVAERIGFILRLKLAGKYHHSHTPLILAETWRLSLGRIKDLVEAATAAYAAMLREDPEAIRAQCLVDLRCLKTQAEQCAYVASEKYAANFLAVAVKAVETITRMADAELDRKMHRDMAREKAEREERRQLTQGTPEFRVNMVVPELPAKKEP